jgi:hypothetical protein
MSAFEESFSRGVPIIIHRIALKSELGGVVSYCSYSAITANEPSQSNQA